MRGVCRTDSVNIDQAGVGAFSDLQRLAWWTQRPDFQDDKHYPSTQQRLPRSVAAPIHLLLPNKSLSASCRPKRPREVGWNHRLYKLGWDREVQKCKEIIGGASLHQMNQMCYTR